MQNFFAINGSLRGYSEISANLIDDSISLSS